MTASSPDRDDLLSLYAYSRWADTRTVESIRSLPPDAYTQELGGGWPSLRATLVHLAGATHAWAERFAGRDATRLPTEAEVPALDDAVKLLFGAHGVLEAFLHTVTPEQQAGPFTWKNLQAKERTAMFWVVLRHVANHGSYHRGQIASMVRRLGGKPLPTDMVLWGIERWEAGR